LSDCYAAASEVKDEEFKNQDGDEVKTEIKDEEIKQECKSEEEEQTCLITYRPLCG